MALINPDSSYNRHSSLLVTVLMSVHNGMPYIYEAMESILGQTFTDFEFLIIDDASTDATPQVLAEYARQDPRIRIVSNPTNIGLTRSLNKGLELAKGRLIARQDADDRSLPDRLHKQVEFLDKHPKVGLLGSSYELIDSEGRVRGNSSNPLTLLEIRWCALFDNPFCHTSVTFRLATAKQSGLGYNVDCRYAQDYEYWSRMLKVTEGCNLPEVLVQYRSHDKQIAATKLQEQQEIATAISRQNVREMGVDMALQDISNIRSLIQGKCNPI